MGRKHHWDRKHLLFLAAGLTFILFSGCISLERFPDEGTGSMNSTEQKTPGSSDEINRSNPSRVHLTEGQTFLLRGEYEKAFQEYQKAAVLARKNPPADEANFFMGMILAYPENPQKDSRRSLAFMKSVVADFPQSRYAGPARAWINLIQENDRLARTYEKSLQDREVLSKEYEKVHKAQEKLIKDNERLIKDNEKLNKMLEEYKQVDIEMEGKKREKGR
jgi:tetratricopeptide (TPR) repeat protein